MNRKQKILQTVGSLFAFAAGASLTGAIIIREYNRTVKNKMKDDYAKDRLKEMKEKNPDLQVTPAFELKKNTK